MMVPTDQQIRTLRDEAGQAGDTEMVGVCDDALTGDEDARFECGHAIAEAESMAAE